MTDSKSGMDSYQITESKDTPTSWLDYTGTIEKEISENGVYYIWSKDKVGNISYEAYSITLIDKEAPHITVTNTLTDWGVKDTLNIHLTDDVIGLSGYQITTSEEEPTSFITIENTLDTTVTYEVIENGTYYVYAKDAYNHISHEKIVIDKIDDKAPVISSIANSSLEEWTNQDVKITLVATDSEMGISKYQIKYSGTNNNWQDIEGSTSTFTSDMNETIYYRVIDKAGNISEEKSTNIKIDKTGPSKPNINNVKENTWTGSDLPISLTSDDTGSGIDHYEWYENGSWTTRALTISDSIGNITYTVTRNETIRFRAIDKVGNISEESTSVVKIDKTNPSQSFSVASSTSGSNGWYKALTIKTTLADGHSGVASAKYCVTTGSSCTPSTSATLSDNTFTIALGTNASAQKVCVNTTDKVGNVSSTSCSSSYSVDTVNPTAKISTSSSNGTVTVNASGSSDSGSGIVTYYYSKDGGQSFTSSTSSSYTFTSLADGTYTFVVKVTDKSGRTSSNVSTSAKVVNNKLILGSTIHSGWTLSQFQWQYYDTYWQLYGPDGTTSLIAQSASTYTLTNYNILSFFIWTQWFDAPTSSTITVNAHLCSTRTSCTKIWTKTFDYASSHEKSQPFSLNIASYTGNYYIKFTASKPSSSLTNIGNGYLKG